jgi:outer membrane protein assembly factor BamC
MGCPKMPKFPFWLLLILTLPVAGCSYIASFFPDKQKEYQYTTEIPALEVPPDLSISTVTGARWRNADGSTTGGGKGPSVTAAPPEGSESSGDSDGRPVLAQNTEDVPLIELAMPLADAWNDVGRALGRMRVEISDRNRADGVYYVYYGGPKEKYKDSGVWDDIASLFSGGGGDGAQEFRVKLEEHKTAKRATTDVFLFDSDNQPVRQGPPLDLLKQLHQELQNIAGSGRSGSGKASDDSDER